MCIPVHWRSFFLCCTMETSFSMSKNRLWKKSHLDPSWLTKVEKSKSLLGYLRKSPHREMIKNSPVDRCLAENDKIHLLVKTKHLFRHQRITDDFSFLLIHRGWQMLRKKQIIYGSKRSSGHREMMKNSLFDTCLVENDEMNLLMNTKHLFWQQRITDDFSFLLIHRGWQI